MNRIHLCGGTTRGHNNYCVDLLSTHTHFAVMNTIHSLPFSCILTLDLRGCMDIRTQTLVRTLTTSKHTQTLAENVGNRPVFDYEKRARVAVFIYDCGARRDTRKKTHG